MTVFALVSTAPAFASSKPVVKTTEATSANGPEETVNGTVNPEGLETKYYFQYGTTESYGSKTAEVSAGSGTASLEEGARLTGLKLSTKYDFRIVATNSDGTSYGSNLSFTTTAKAKAPEFVPAAKQKFTGRFGVMHMTFDIGAAYATCPKGTSTGEITGADTLGKSVLTFTGCTVKRPKTSKTECSLNTLGRSEGELVFNAVKGELGTVATSEAASGVGLLIKPEGATWAEFAGNACSAETAMTGDIAVEVATIGKASLTNKLGFDAVAEQIMKIKKITLDSGEVLKPELVSFSEPSSIEGLDELTFEKALEVT